MSYQNGQHNNGNSLNIPVQSIHQAHIRAEKARSDYQGYIMSGYSNSEMERLHHQNLHHAVMDYYERLKYLLRTHNKMEKYWHGMEPADPTAPFENGTAFLYVESTYNAVEQEEYEAFLEQISPDNVDAEEAITRYVTGVDKQSLPGMIIVEYDQPLFGLKNLENAVSVRKTTVSTQTGMLGVRSETNEVPDVLPEEVLRRVLTSLNEAVQDLGLLVDISDSKDTYMASDANTDEYDEPFGTARKPLSDPRQ